MRLASCRCGCLEAYCAGDPLRVSVCHCSACQRRTGSPFSSQARFPADKVNIKGAFQIYRRTADSGSVLSYKFCPNCGSTIAYEIDAYPDLVAVPVGAFSDDDFPAPAYSIYERRKRPWVSITSEETMHID